MSISKHPRHDFLIERIAFFSDAVFAIAITLLTIEIHPPSLLITDTNADVMRKLGEKLPELIGLIVSFWLIGVTWLRHHQLFKYVDNYDIKFMVINLLLLMTIILFPFSTSFLFNTIFTGFVSKPQVIFYLGIPLCSNLILYLMYKRVNEKHLEQKADEQFHGAIYAQKNLIISFMLALLWIIIVPLQYHPFGYIFLMYAMVIGIIHEKRKKKKLIKHAGPQDRPTN